MPRNREGDHKAAALTDEANRRKHGTWNECLYQFLLLSSKQSMTVPVALAQFLNSDEAPWNYMMATAIVYALPPVAIYYAFRRRMTAGLAMGGVKG